MVKDGDHALSVALDIGFPVMIKASAGGGGKVRQGGAERSGVWSSVGSGWVLAVAMVTAAGEALPATCLCVLLRLNGCHHPVPPLPENAGHAHCMERDGAAGGV